MRRLPVAPLLLLLMSWSGGCDAQGAPAPTPTIELATFTTSPTPVPIVVSTTEPTTEAGSTPLDSPVEALTPAIGESSSTAAPAATTNETLFPVPELPWSANANAFARVPQTSDAGLITPHVDRRPASSPSSASQPTETVSTTAPPDPPLVTTSPTEAPTPSPVPATSAPTVDTKPPSGITTPASRPGSSSGAPTVSEHVGTVSPPQGLSPEFNLIPLVDPPPDSATGSPASPANTPIRTREPESTKDSAASSTSSEPETGTTSLPSSDQSDSEPATQGPPGDSGVNAPILSAGSSGAASTAAQATRDKDALTAVNKLTSSGSDTESADGSVLLVISLVGGCGVVVGVLIAVEIYLRRSRRRHIQLCGIERPIIVI